MRRCPAASMLPVLVRKSRGGLAASHGHESTVVAICKFCSFHAIIFSATILIPWINKMKLAWLLHGLRICLNMLHSRLSNEYYEVLGIFGEWFFFFNCLSHYRQVIYLDFLQSYTTLKNWLIFSFFLTFWKTFVFKEFFYFLIQSDQK